MAKLCAAGRKVRMLELPGVGHGFIGRDSANAAAGWLADRFDGKAPPTDCAN
jgi:acetyl esterase/lipase